MDLAPAVPARAPAAVDLAEVADVAFFVPVADPPAAVPFLAADRDVPVPAVVVPAPVVDRLAARAPAVVFLAVRVPVPALDSVVSVALAVFVDLVALRVGVPAVALPAEPVPDPAVALPAVRPPLCVVSPLAVRVPAAVPLAAALPEAVLGAPVVPEADFLAAAVEVLAVLPPPAVDTIASALVLRAARVPARFTLAADRAAVPVADGAAPSSPVPCSRGRACVNQATAAPVRATGHSTTPATPSTPAPVYTASLRRRGDTRSTAARAPPAARPAVPAPGILRSTEAVARSGCGRPDEVS
ncbi:hypothetical protein JS756_05415 [Streptomyces actuosus]|uniref:Uncharacterized protein n=1 Tax=Streptomyces actuosus TaxID=1885 RepID=A0ABS2VKD3_STRAS|nr:hypothetical protein [Streptomyces actuosus]MBN0043550.1 hypothetical protein [Streptomyces actuosus]